MLIRDCLTRFASSRRGATGFFLLLPPLAVLVGMLLAPGQIPPGAGARSVSTEAVPQSFDAGLREARFIPLRRRQLRRTYRSALRARAVLAACRTPAEARAWHQILLQMVDDYNRLVQESPPMAFQNFPLPRSLTAAAVFSVTTISAGHAKSAPAPVHLGKRPKTPYPLG